MKAYDAEWWVTRTCVQTRLDGNPVYVSTEPEDVIIALRSRLAHEIRERRRVERALSKDMKFWEAQWRKEMMARVEGEQ